MCGVYSGQWLQDKEVFSSECGNFLKELLVFVRFYVSPTQTRLLVIPFGQDATVLRNDDKASFRRWTLGKGYATKKEIEAMTELHNITNLHIALDLAFQAYATEGKQDRQGVPNIVILITDGKTRDETALDAVLQSKVTYVTNRSKFLANTQGLRNIDS